METSEAVRRGPDAPHSERWGFCRRALVELAVLSIVAAIVLLLVPWVGKPLTRLGCSDIVAFELAVPGMRAEGSTEGPRTIDELVAECGDSKDRIGDALRSSIWRDALLIAAYVPLLWWCCRRMGGMSVGSHRRPSGSPVAWLLATRADGGGPARRGIRAVSWFLQTRVDTTEPARRGARVVSWFVVVAGLLDVLENVLMWVTADDLEHPSSFVVNVTAAAATAKFLLLVPAVVIGLRVLLRLAQAGSRRKGPPVCGKNVVLPPPDATRRWQLPFRSKEGNLETRLARPSGAYGICLSGGGIRSATFGLGALQALEGAKEEKWRLRSASYLSAVSGGSYIAATYQFFGPRRGRRPRPSRGPSRSIRNRNGGFHQGTAGAPGRAGRGPPAPALHAPG